MMPSWECFSVEKATQMPITVAYLANNFVSATLRTRATKFDLVEFVCTSAQRPIPVVTVCEQIRTVSLYRGRASFGMVGDVLDERFMFYCPFVSVDTARFPNSDEERDAGDDGPIFGTSEKGSPSY
jgi:hypothetical protein